MPRITFLVVLFSSCVVTYGQAPIDSLRKALGQTNSVNQSAYLHSLIGYHFFNQKQYDSALSHYYDVWGIPGSVDKTVLAETANGIGAIYGEKDYNDSAIYYYEQALVLYDNLDDSLSYHIRANIGLFYKNVGQYQKALDVCFDLVRKLDEKLPSRELASSFNTIALVYNAIDEDDLALEYHKKALSARKVLGLPSIRHSYSNLGESYLKLRQYDSALINLKRALELKRKANDIKGLPITLNIIGRTYLAKGQYRQAEKSLAEALQINSDKEDRLVFVASLNSLAQVHSMRGDYLRAAAFLKEAESLAREVKSIESLAETLHAKARILKAQHQPSKAFEALEELQLIKDSLLAIEKVEDILAMEIRYEAEKKAQEIVRLTENEKSARAEVQARDNWIITLVALVILLIVIAFLIFVLLRTSRKSKSRVETLLKELHHRVKNNLQILSSLLILQSQELTDEKAVEAVKTSEGRVNAMALIHKKLYNTDRNREINLKEYITELVRDLVHSYGFTNRQLSLDLQIEEIKLDVDKAIPLGLIINELVSNAFKYAFEGTAHPELKVNVSVNEKKILVLELSDNGKDSEGVSLDNPSSFGLKMVKILSRDLRGSLSISHSNGTGFSLNIPIST